jgi:type VI secretion system secreted protein Hcp
MAAVEYFLKVTGIPGESAKKGHENEIDLVSWSWGETNSGSHAVGGGGGAGQVAMQDFSFQMVVNKASPELFLKCATGKHIDEATLTCREAGGKQQEYLKIKFTDFLVSSYQVGPSGNPDQIKPVENITFNFAKIQVDYAPQKKDGSLDAYVSHWVNVNTGESA